MTTAAVYTTTCYRDSCRLRGKRTNSRCTCRGGIMALTVYRLSGASVRARRVRICPVSRSRKKKRVALVDVGLASDVDSSSVYVTRSCTTSHTHTSHSSQRQCYWRKYVITSMLHNVNATGTHVDITLSEIVAHIRHTVSDTRTHTSHCQ